MISYSNSIVIMAPVSEVFAYVNEPTNAPEWITGVVEVSDVIGRGEGRHSHWVLKFAGVRLHGDDVVIEWVEDECCANQSIGMFESTWTKVVEPHEDGTKLTIKFEYELPVPLLGKLGERLTIRRVSRDIDSSLLNAKELIELGEN